MGPSDARRGIAAPLARPSCRSHAAAAPPGRPCAPCTRSPRCRRGRGGSGSFGAAAPPVPRPRARVRPTSAARIAQAPSRAAAGNCRSRNSRPPPQAGALPMTGTCRPGPWARCGSGRPPRPPSNRRAPRPSCCRPSCRYRHSRQHALASPNAPGTPATHGCAAGCSRDTGGSWSWACSGRVRLPSERSSNADRRARTQAPAVRARRSQVSGSKT